MGHCIKIQFLMTAPQNSEPSWNSLSRGVTKEVYIDQQDDYLSAPFSGGQKGGKDPRSGSKIQVSQQLLYGQDNGQPTQVYSALRIQGCWKADRLNFERKRSKWLPHLCWYHVMEYRLLSNRIRSRNGCSSTLHRPRWQFLSVELSVTDFRSWSQLPK